MNVPLYQVVTADLLKRIRAGEFTPGERLPANQALEVHYGTGRITILRALQELSLMGEIRRVRGHGTFVANGVEKAKCDSQVVVVLPQGEAFGAPELLTGVSRCLAGLMTVGTRDSENEPARERAILQALLLQNPAGIILLPSIGSHHNTDLISRVIAQRIPLVVVDRRLTYFDVPFVSCDNRSGAREVVSHLVKRGRTRIAFVGHALDWVSSEQERFAGYCHSLAECGRPVDMDLVLLTGVHRQDYPREALNHVVRQLRERKADAVFAVNDLLAIALIRAFRETGLQVPSDIAVAGFDDIDFARHLKPSLTTFKQPFSKIGKEAAMLILAGKTDEGPTLSSLEWGLRDVKVQGTLVIRDST